MFVPLPHGNGEQALNARPAVDAGAADRLRESGFEVAHDGSQAVDTNGCDNTVFLMQAP